MGKSTTTAGCMPLFFFLSAYAIVLLSLYATAEVERSREKSRESGIEQQDWEREHQGEGGEWPVLHPIVAGDEVVNTHRGRQFLWRLQQDKGDHKLAPGVQKGEHGGDGDSRGGKRQDDQADACRRAGAVDLRRLVQLARNVVDEVLEQPDREWQRGRAEQENGRGRGVKQVELNEERVRGNHQQLH